MALARASKRSAVVPRRGGPESHHIRADRTQKVGAWGGAGWGSTLGRGQVLDAAVGGCTWCVYPVLLSWTLKTVTLMLCMFCRNLTQLARKQGKLQGKGTGEAVALFDGSALGRTPGGSPAAHQGPSSLASHIWPCLPQSQSFLVILMLNPKSAPPNRTQGGRPEAAYWVKSQVSGSQRPPAHGAGVGGDTPAEGVLPPYILYASDGDVGPGSEPPGQEGPAEGSLPRGRVCPAELSGKGRTGPVPWSRLSLTVR